MTKKRFCSVSVFLVLFLLSAIMQGSGCFTLNVSGSPTAYALNEYNNEGLIGTLSSTPVFSVGSRSGFVGQTVPVSINISDLPPQAIGGGLIDIHYDPAIADVLEESVIKPGALLADLDDEYRWAFAANHKYEHNVVRVAWTVMDGGLTEEGELIVIYFTLVQEGAAPLNLIVTQLIDVDFNDVECSVVNGQITVWPADYAGRVILTESLQLAPGPYYVGDTLNASFTIQNIGNDAVTLDKLLLGGRYNGGELPGGGFPDFTYQTVTLQPGQTHQYQGTFTVPEPGPYEFFIAYYLENPTAAQKESLGLDEHNWNTCIELGPGLTDANRTRTITVNQAEPHCWAENLSVLNANSPIPTFRWTFRDSRGKSMQYYQIRVYEDDVDKQECRLVWDSGLVRHALNNNAQISVEYKGRRLETSKNYFFAVSVDSGQNCSNWHSHNFTLNTPVIYDPYEGVSWGGRMLVQLHAHYKDDAPVSPTRGQDFYDTPFLLGDRLEYHGSVQDMYAAKGYTNVFYTEHSGSDWETWLPPDHLERRSKAVECTGEKTHLLALGITELVNPVGKSIPERVEQVVSQTWIGGMAALAIPAHPKSLLYRWNDKDLDQAGGCQAIEIYTGVLEYFPDGPLYNQALATCIWDKMLRENKIIWGVATDDYTPGLVLGRFGPDLGAVVIPYSGGNYCYSDWKVLDEIRRGAFYATTGSSGPEMTIHVENGTIHVTAPSRSRVYFISQNGVQKTKNFILSGGTASYDVISNDNYIRIEVNRYRPGIDIGYLPPGQIHPGIDVDTSWSQPIFIQPTGKANATILPGEEGGLSMHYSALNVDALEETVEFNLSLPEDRTPVTLPPEGVVGYPYLLEISGKLSSPARLTLSYESQVVIPYLVPSLSIYHLPPGEERWIKLDSDLNREHKELRAEVREEGWYAISTDRSSIITPMGVSAPVIEIIRPEQENGVFNTPFTFEADIIGDTGIWKMEFFLGEIWLGYDIWPDDGWSVEVDPSLYAEGEYCLTVIAEDLDGRTAQAQKTVILEGGVAPPAINITNPSPGSSIGAEVLVEGTFSTEIGLQSIIVGIGDIPLAAAEVDDGSWHCTIPGALLPAGSYELWAEVRDIYGNSARDEILVQIGPVLHLSPSAGMLLNDQPTQIWLLAGGLGDSLGELEAVVSFDPSQLEITDVLEGNSLAGEGGETAFSYSLDPAEGLLEINIRLLSGDPAPVHGGHLATIEVTPRQGTAATEVKLDSSVLFTPDGDIITHVTAGAEFTLNSPPAFVNLPVSLKLSVDKPFTFQVEATHQHDNDITFKLVGDDPGLLNTLTIDPATGNLSWPEPATGIYELTVQSKDHHHTLTESAIQLIAVKYGSVKGDGKVDVGDAILVLRSIVGLSNLDLLQETAADVNGDGRIDVGDAILILRRIVGLNERFPVEEDE